MKNILPFLCCLLILACPSSRERIIAYKARHIYNDIPFDCDVVPGHALSPDPYTLSVRESMERLSRWFGLPSLKDIPLKDSDYVVRFYESPMYLSVLGPEDGHPPESILEVASVGGEMSIEHRAGPESIEYINSGKAASRVRAYVRKWDLMEMKDLMKCDTVRYGSLTGARYLMEIKRGNRYHSVIFEIGNYAYAPYMEMIELFNDFY